MQHARDDKKLPDWMLYLPCEEFWDLLWLLADDPPIRGVVSWEMVYRCACEERRMLFPHVMRLYMHPKDVTLVATVSNLGDRLYEIGARGAGEEQFKQALGLYRSQADKFLTSLGRRRPSSEL